MAYDEDLSERVADYLAEEPELTDRKMFGGIGYMIHGNMAVGVSGDSLMVRVGPEQYDEALSNPGVRPFDMKGGEMRGWVLVDGETVANDETLAHWVDRGRAIARNLPPK